MIDKTDISCRFRKSIESYDDNAVVQKLIVNKLCRILKEYIYASPDIVLEIGCGTGLLTSAIQKIYYDSALFINDLVPEMCSTTAKKYDVPLSRCLVGDIELLELTGRYNLVVSSSTFQWFTYPEETFENLSANITPKGYLVFSTFGHKNLKELRKVTGKGLAYPSKEELVAFLSPYFDVLHIEENFHKLHFRHPLDILRHLKNTGANATATPQIWTKGQMSQFVEDYTRQFSRKEVYPLTYHPLYFVCQKKKL